MKIFKTITTLIFAIICLPLHADVNAYFNQIKSDPNRLYAFFKSMPKGGELHFHLAGGVYPEIMVELAAKGKYCLDTKSHALSSDYLHCEGVKSKDIMAHPDLYAETIRTWSMKDFVAGKESGHDHFFNTFIKFMPIAFAYRPQLLAEIVKHAASQKELYLEIMTIPDNANSISFGDLIKDLGENDQKRKLLLANQEFQNNINKTIEESERILEKTQQELGCQKNPNAQECQVKVKFLYYVLREQPLNNLFAQALNAFEAASRSKGLIVGVNLVQAEDGIISLRDYRQHMAVFQYFHALYPKVNIALHAGELAQGLVVPQELTYHIHDALMIGQAKRIGHGVDIAYEDNPEAILEFMKNNNIPVEINLTSNKSILDIEGKNHPLNYYLEHNVPVVLSTDDEGILRTNLTRQYLEAALAHHLDYQTLKQINRNTLTYAFIPGQSIWAKPGEVVAECRDLKSNACQTFIKDNEKGQLQWKLEQQLLAFEERFNPTSS